MNGDADAFGLAMMRIGKMLGEYPASL